MLTPWVSRSDVQYSVEQARETSTNSPRSVCSQVLAVFDFVATSLLALTKPSLIWLGSNYRFTNTEYLPCLIILSMKPVGV